MTNHMPLEGFPSGDRNACQSVNFGIVNCVPSPELLKQMKDDLDRGGSAKPYLTHLEIVDDRNAGHGTANGAREHWGGRGGFAEGEHVGSSLGRDGDARVTRDENVQHATRALLQRWAEFKRDMRWTEDADIKLHRTAPGEGAAKNS